MNALTSLLNIVVNIESPVQPEMADWRLIDHRIKESINEGGWPVGSLSNMPAPPEAGWFRGAAKRSQITIVSNRAAGEKVPSEETACLQQKSLALREGLFYGAEITSVNPAVVGCLFSFSHPAPISCLRTPLRILNKPGNCR
jgi:hypothetical protein